MQAHAHHPCGGEGAQGPAAQGRRRGQPAQLAPGRPDCGAGVGACALACISQPRLYVRNGVVPGVTRDTVRHKEGMPNDDAACMQVPSGSGTSSWWGKRRCITALSRVGDNRRARSWSRATSGKRTGTGGPSCWAWGCLSPSRAPSTPTCAQVARTAEDVLEAQGRA